MSRENTARQLGALLGQAIGDALGVPLEFKAARAIAETHPLPSDRLKYTATPRFGDAWKPGEWSDDTEQALCILHAFLHDDGQIVPQTLASFFLRWLNEDGRGCGGHTMLVLNHPQFPTNPIAVSHAGWVESDRYSAPNGAVMRTSAIGVLRPYDLNWTELAAVRAAQVTHYDPRCVASAVAVSIAVAVLVQGGSIPDAMVEALERAKPYHGDVEKFMFMSLDELELDEGMGTMRRPPIGYTYKCLGAGFWALRNMEENIKSGVDRTSAFNTCLDLVLAAGGDVDTNAAVAGALMGAHVGSRNLPPNLVGGLINIKTIMDLISRIRIRQAQEDSR